MPYSIRFLYHWGSLEKTWAFSIGIFFSLGAIADDCKVETILAENTKSSLQVFTEVKEAVQDDRKLKNDLALEELSEPRDNISLMYVADINNDGKKEYIFTSPGSGSGGIINIFVFEKMGDKSVYVGDPPKPKALGDGPWYFNWHRDSKTRQIQFLVNGCGTTFMQFDLDHKLERYL